VESVPPAKAKEMVDSGNWVLVDIRPDNKHQAAHPRGAKNVQLYKKAS
jgi:rhodanese-related sulfurtransferase